jgi:two-component system NtrC family response regulator
LDPSIRNPEAAAQKPWTQEKSAPGLSLARSLPLAMESLERRMIEEALRESGGNKQKAAQALGLSRQGLIKKLKRLSIRQ